jgi:hypothetical protein
MKSRLLLLTGIVAFGASAASATNFRFEIDDLNDTITVTRLR